MANSIKNTESKSNFVLSETYKLLEKEVNNLESIDNWNIRVEKMKELREKILEEQQKLGELVSMVLKNDSSQFETKKKKKQDLNDLVSSFRDSKLLDEKIMLYRVINSHINDIEKQIFDE